MAIDNYKVTTSEVNGKNVKSAPDMLTSDAQTNKNWFDRLVEYFILKYNGLIDYLQSNLVGRDATGRGLTYKDDKMNWRYAVDKGSSFGFSFSGNIQPTQAGTYETTIADDLYITQTDLMDCFMYINNVEYECGDSWADGVLFYTKTVIGTTEVRLTYNSLTHELVMSSTSNPLDTTYWNVEIFRGVAEKVKRKSLPGELTNDAYTELKDRIDGLTGEIGKTIANTVIEYGVSDDEATPPSAWQPTPPVVTAGQWMWVKTTTIYNDLSEITTYSKSYIGTDGEDGISVTVQSVQHYDTYTIVTLIDSDGTVSSFRIDDGSDGDDGLPGANGYVHFAWANSADGSVDFSTHESFGKDYLGTYSDNIVEDSQDYHDYSWTYIRGEKGDTGEQGEQGEPGEGVAKVEPQFHLHTSDTATEQEIAQWTWTDTLEYASGYYVWQREKITLTDETVIYSDAYYNEALTESVRLSFDTAQYFWQKPTGGTQSVPTGAYVTQVPRHTDAGTGYDDAEPTGGASGGSLLLRSAGAFIRTAKKCVAAFVGSGITLYDPNDNNPTYDSNISQYHGAKVAEFTSTTAQVGKDSGSHFKMNAGSLQAYDSNNTLYFEVSRTGLVFGANAAATTSQVNSVAQTASAAQSTANTASNTASAAQSTANAAQSTANTASNTATSVKNTVDSSIEILNNDLYMYTGTTPTTSAKGDSVRIADDGVYIYTDGNEVARYGDATRIGREDETRVEITPSSFAIVASTGAETFSASIDPTSTEEQIVREDVNVTASGTKTVSLLSSLSTGTNFSVVLDVVLLRNNLATGFVLEAPFTKGTSSTQSVGGSDYHITYSIYYNGATSFTISYTLSSGYTISRNKLACIKYPKVIAKSIVNVNGGLYLDGHTSPVGTVLSSQASWYNLASGSYTKLPATALPPITLTTGTWVITAYANFEGNSADSRRGLRLYSNTDSSYIEQSFVVQKAINASDIPTRMGTTYIMPERATTQEITVQLYQNSGSTLQVSVTLCATRIA